MCKKYSIWHKNGSLSCPHHTPVMCSYVHETIAIVEKIKCEEGHKNQSTFNPAEEKKGISLIDKKASNKRMRQNKRRKMRKEATTMKIYFPEFIYTFENEESEQKMDTSMKWSHVNKVSENEIKNFITEKEEERKSIVVLDWRWTGAFFEW